MRNRKPRRGRVSARQMSLPGVRILEVGGNEMEIRSHRIPHKQILKALQEVDEAQNVIQIYRTQVLPLKTRVIFLLGKKGPARIIKTLLGFEVQSSYKRIHCPDMVTARYIKVFTEIGCHTIRLPYDPTVTARLMPAIEDSVTRIRGGIRSLFPESRALQVYVQRKIFAIIRSQLRAE